MIIREMKSDMCLCDTPVHTGAFLIGILSVVLEVISLLFEISSHTEGTPDRPFNTSEFENDQVKTFEYAGFYADKIVVGSGLTRHLFYYVLHLSGLIAAVLLIYGNRRSIPKLYIPYLVVGAVEIIVAAVECIMFTVAIIGVRSGAFVDIPEGQVRSVVVLFLVLAIIIEIGVIIISIYFMWIVWRGKGYLEEHQNNPYINNAFSVSYTNQAADVPSVPATYRI